MNAAERPKQSISFYTAASKAGDITLMVWPFAGNGCMSVTLGFSEAEARRLAAELVAIADKLPRVAEASDLGIAA